MSEPRVSVDLSASEWRLVSDLRAIPASALKEKALQLFAAVVIFTGEFQFPFQPDPCPEIAALDGKHIFFFGIGDNSLSDLLHFLPDID